jgi:hypothetical protein
MKYSYILSRKVAILRFVILSQIDVKMSTISAKMEDNIDFAAKPMYPESKKV